MASRKDKSSYDEILREAEELTEGVTPAGDYSLEEILAEYGGSRQQQILADVEAKAEEQGAAEELQKPADAADVPAPAGAAPQETEKPAAQPEPQSGTEEEAGEETGLPPQPPKDEPWRIALRKEQEEIERQRREIPPAPAPISVEEVVGRTVDTVMEEQQETLLPEKKHRRGLFSRKRLVDTEELYQQPEEPEETQPEEPEPEEEPIGPEEPLEDMAAKWRQEEKRQRKNLPAALVLTLALTALMVLTERGASVPVWSESQSVQNGVLLVFLVGMLLLCRSVVSYSIRMLKKKRCTGELAAVLSAVAAAGDCAARGLLAGRSAAMPYALTACAALLFSLWGGVRRSSGMYNMYRTAAMSEAPPYLVTDTPQGACKQPGQIDGFYTDTVQEDLPLVWQSALLPVILMGTLVFAGLSSLGQGKGADFLLCWSAILSASASLALPLCWGLPWSRLSSQLQKNGCAVAGWRGAELVSRKRTMILSDLDLFPPGTVRLNGIKVFGEVLPHAVSYAASLVRASGCGLERLFDELVRSERGQYYDVSDFSYYEEGGYSAAIHGETVLLGTASFMRKMDVRLPGNLNLRTGMFLAVDGQLSAVFAVKYSASENVDWALRMLKRNHVTPILASRDPNITPALLKRKFFSKGMKVEYPPLAARLALSEQEEGRGRPRALLLREGLLPYAETVIGSRRLCSAARRCTVLSLLGSAAGTLLSYYLAMTGSFALMSPVTLLVFLLLWVLPVLLLSGWTGRF